MNLDSIFKRAEADIAPALARIDAVAYRNTDRVLSAFRQNRVGENHFAPSTGYGYGDPGREVFERTFAAAMGAPAALVRPHFINGTHAISCALYGALRPGDTLLCATGTPYDTLLPVIYGLEGEGSLAEYGIKTHETDLLEHGGGFDENAYLSRLAQETRASLPRCALIQRSRGYSSRPALSADTVEKICRVIRRFVPEAIIVVDNCYGEFVEEREPETSGGAHSADLLCGSLIKNPGGGIAPEGGYIVGGERACALAAARLCVPGIGGEAGSCPGGYRSFFQGLFLAPHTVAQALKTAVFAARVCELAGFAASPAWDEERRDIIQALNFGAPEPMLAFIRGIQSGSPIDSHVTPEPWEMPGYDSPVVMAAGAFVQGASIELSADAPMREPYTAYLQGGLTYESGRIGVMRALSALF